MKKILKFIKWGSLSLVGLFLVVIIVGGILVKSFVTKDFVATIIEDNINGRVEIRDISVPFWAALSGITVEGFKVGHKDAEMKKPMEERAPMQNEVISFESFNFRLALGALITSLGKDLTLTSLVIQKPKANVVLYAAGGNNIVPLLTKPKTKESTKKEEPTPTKSEPFSIKSIPTVIKMGKIGMEDGLFNVTVQKLGNTLVASNVSFLLKDLLVDPNDLTNKNRVNLSTGITLDLKENKGGGVRSFKIIFKANGQITPFDPQTGRVTQSARVKFGLLKGSTITGLAVLNKLKDETAMLNKIGVNLNFLGDSQTLTYDSMATISYNFGKITFLEPLNLRTSDFVFELTKEDFMHIKTLAHLFRGNFLLAQKHTEKLKAQAKKSVEQAIGPIVKTLPQAVRPQAEKSITPDKVTNNLLAPAMEGDQVALGVESSGNIASPNVRITKPVFPDVNQLLQDQLAKAGVDVKAAINAEIDKQKKAVSKKIQREADKATSEGKKKLEAGAKEAIKGLF